MRYLLLLLCACGPLSEIKGVTPCGLEYRGEYPLGGDVVGYDLPLLTRLESLSVQFDLVSCKKLKGVGVWVRTAGKDGFWDEYGDGKLRAGQAFCNSLQPRIEIAASTPTVVLHELHHIEQGCLAPLPVDPGLDEAHADWIRSGVDERMIQAADAFKEQP